MKNEMNKIPTPETNAMASMRRATSEWVAHGCDLERRLTIAREALMAIADKSANIEHAERMADRALKLTAPKP